MLTDDKDHPGIDKPKDDDPSKQNEAYLILSEEERAKGFVRPVRLKYLHVGIRPKHPIRDLTNEEKERFDGYGYVKYEEYPDSDSSAVGRYWSEEQLTSGCGGALTVMAQELGETYARDPSFYGATWCVACEGHHPVSEFVWDGTDEIVGS